jgi:hypothetical protein
MRSFGTEISRNRRLKAELSSEVCMAFLSNLDSQGLLGWLLGREGNPMGIPTASSLPILPLIMGIPFQSLKKRDSLSLSVRKNSE